MVDLAAKRGCEQYQCSVMRAQGGHARASAADTCRHRQRGRSGIVATIRPAIAQHSVVARSSWFEWLKQQRLAQCSRTRACHRQFWLSQQLPPSNCSGTNAFARAWHQAVPHRHARQYGCAFGWEFNGFTACRPTVLVATQTLGCNKQKVI